MSSGEKVVFFYHLSVPEVRVLHGETPCIYTYNRKKITQNFDDLLMIVHSEMWTMLNLFPSAQHFGYFQVI